MTNAELAILGLVGEAPRHGYEIEQVIEERGMRAWTEIGFSSIYYLLKKLEQKDLIQGWLEHNEQGPARKVYHITKVGQSVLREEVIGALSVPKRCYLPIQIGLSEMPVVGSQEALSALKEYRKALQERLDAVRESHERQPGLPYHVEAQFGHSYALIKAELTWLDGFIKKLESMHKKTNTNSDVSDLEEK